MRLMLCVIGLTAVFVLVYLIIILMRGDKQ